MAYLKVSIDFIVLTLAFRTRAVCGFLAVSLNARITEVVVAIGLELTVATATFFEYEVHS